MSYCTVHDNELRIHIDDSITEIPLDPRNVISRSPKHFIVHDNKDLLLCEILIGLNEIYIHSNKKAYQLPLNEHVVEWFSHI
jgi:hypothetical protein